LEPDQINTGGGIGMDKVAVRWPFSQTAFFISEKRHHRSRPLFGFSAPAEVEDVMVTQLDYAKAGIVTEEMQRAVSREPISAEDLRV